MKIVFLVFTIPTLIFAQDIKKPDPWIRFSGLMGSWTGVGEGQPGTSVVERQYTFILNNKFIEVKNKSTYAPQSKNPKGETHDDLGLVSYDKRRKLFIFRQFHTEGFVNQYVLDTTLTTEKKIVFLTEAIENIPSGWQARETYNLLGQDEFEEVFELAEPGKPFEIYSRTTFKRKK